MPKNGRLINISKMTVTSPKPRDTKLGVTP